MNQGDPFILSKHREYFKMDTEAFRKAYTDYRKVEASVLSAQSSQWTLHAERSANCIDLATVKRPIWHVPYAGFAPVDTMETKKLYPKKVSNLMPLSSTFTVDPTAGTERLFLDQWHQGLGLPNIMDDKAIDSFKLMSKRNYIDNYRSIMENTRSSEFQDQDGKEIIALCRNFLSAIGASNSRGPLLRISKQVYDKLVLVNAKLSPQVLTAIYDTIEKITNKKNNGNLDLRIEKEQAIKGELQLVGDTLVRKGGALTDRAAPSTTTTTKPTGTTTGTTTTTTKTTNPPTIPNQGDKVAVDGEVTDVTDRPGLPTSSAQTVVNPYQATSSAPAVAPPPVAAPAVPLVPITKTASLTNVGLIDKDDAKPVTLNDLLAMKSNFTKSRDLIENAYTAANHGANIQSSTSTYSITDAAIPRGATPTASQTAYIQKLDTDQKKAEAELAMNMQIQKLMTQGMTDKQARDKVAADVKASRESKPTVDEAAAAILSNTETQAKQVNANNTALSATTTLSPLPITNVPATPANPAQQVPGQQMETEKPMEMKDAATVAQNPPDIPNAPAPASAPAAAPAPAAAVEEEDLAENDLGNIEVDNESVEGEETFYKSFQETLDSILSVWDPKLTAKDFARKVYEVLQGDDKFEDAWNNNKIPDGIKANSFLYVLPRNMYSVFERFEKTGFINVLRNAPKELNDKLFKFVKEGIPAYQKFISATSEGEKDFKVKGSVLGEGKPKRARSTSSTPKKRAKVSYAPGYKSKKQRKLDRKK
jgi:uncharacterized protein YoaH (UPF0181 family)